MQSKGIPPRERVTVDPSVNFWSLLILLLPFSAPLLLFPGFDSFPLRVHSVSPSSSVCLVCLPLPTYFCPTPGSTYMLPLPRGVCHPSGSYLTHEASGLDEQGEAREAFLNGSDGHKRKEEFFI